jgi:Zn-dependent protease/CBS domain-containing protein
MGDDLKLGRVAGFPLAMNWSVLVIAWLLTWSLATGSFPYEAPGHPDGTYWVVGLAAALVFFGSLLAHELAHAIVARRHGVEVKGLTLWLFGGVASLGSEPPTPRADFRIAVAGPATSLALAAGFGLVAGGLKLVGVAHIVVVAASWLSGINLMLGVFNLIPGAPLDGGRLLRAFLWHHHGDQVRAAVTAARAGAVVAYGLIGLGLLEFLAGASVGGLWLVFIGWFVLSAARAEEAHVLTRDALGGLRVAEVMSPRPIVAPGWITAGEFIERYLLGSRHSAYPVEGFDGGIAGLVTLAQLRRVPPAQRDTTRLVDIAIAIPDVAIAAPRDSLVSLLDRLTPDAGGRALVFDHGELVGILTPTDVARAAELRGMRDGRHLTAP